MTYGTLVAKDFVATPEGDVDVSINVPVVKDLGDHHAGGWCWVDAPGKPWSFFIDGDSVSQDEFTAFVGENGLERMTDQAWKEGLVDEGPDEWDYADMLREDGPDTEWK